MKLVRYGAPGGEKPGVLDRSGRVRDLSGLVGDIDPHALRAGLLQRLRGSNVDELPLVSMDGLRLGCPVGKVGKVIAIGLNYVDHAKEANLPIPAEPVMFSKAVTSITGPHDNVVMPQGSVKSDWEVELAIVMGRVARNVPQEEALQHVAGFALANDVSEREWQWDHGGTWDKGKGFDTFLPIGPWLVTTDEIVDPQDIGLWLDVNGKRMQTGHTGTMIFSCAHVISYVSRLCTLLPGDVVVTGTPPGVGMGLKPPMYLRHGDVMTVGSSALGEQRQAVHAFDARLLPEH